jgi:small-conductance mechanosensitive channel/CRP-like cAMP-binding protein
MPHYPGHLIMGVAALAATLAIQAFTINRHVRRKLRLSLALLGAYVLANVVLAVLGSERFAAQEETLRAAERLALAAAIINLLVAAAINPLRADRIPERFPTIVQDFVVIGLVMLAATFISDKLVATSAVGAVVLGFALQDTLGNAFAGLALQSEKPFHIGHWIRVGEFEGRVSEVTWRATKLRTRTGNFVIVPNNLVSKEAITNYSEPAQPARLQVEVGVSYDAAPNTVKAAMLRAISNAPGVLRAPGPDARLVSFDGSAITYRARFWVNDYELNEEAEDQVRSALYYAFMREGIEIPYPIQVEYSKEPPPPHELTASAGRARILAGVDLLATLTDQQRLEIAEGTVARVFADGEPIVRQGEPGRSMYVLCSGRVVVKLEPDGREVATIERGGYFGEMSLLTGDVRSATVVARGDVQLIEIDADVFRRLGSHSPQAIEGVAVAALTRRTELEQVRTAAASTAVAEAPATLMTRMRKFLRFG